MAEALILMNLKVRIVVMEISGRDIILTDYQPFPIPGREKHPFMQSCTDFPGLTIPQELWEKYHARLTLAQEKAEKSGSVDIWLDESIAILNEMRELTNNPISQFRLMHCIADFDDFKKNIVGEE